MSIEEIIIADPIKLIGGQELYAIKLAELCCKLGYNTTLLVSSRGSRLLHDKIFQDKEDIGFNIECYKLKTLGLAIKVIKRYLDTRIRSKKILLICNSFNTAIVTGLVSVQTRRFKSINVCHIHINQLKGSLPYLRYNLYVALNSLFNTNQVNIAISPEIYVYLRKEKKQVIKIYNASRITCEEHESRRKYYCDILYAGRLDRQKGIDYLCTLCEKLAEKRVNIRIAICGTGPKLKEIEVLCKKHKGITYYGFKKRPYTRFTKCLALFTSEYEGFPLALREAIDQDHIPIIRESKSMRLLLGKKLCLIDKVDKASEIILDLMDDPVKQKQIKVDIENVLDGYLTKYRWDQRWCTIIRDFMEG